MVRPITETAVIGDKRVDPFSGQSTPVRGTEPCLGAHELWPGAEYLIFVEFYFPEFLS